MRRLLRIAALVLAGGSLVAQEASVPVPGNVTAEGVPPIPASIATRLAPYGQFRRAQLLSWHPTRREMLVTTTTDKVMQVHAVTSPGAAPKPLTDVAGGVTVAAAYSPAGGDWFVYRKDPAARETHQLWRQDAGAPPVMLTDGTSRNGTPAWSPKSGRIAFDSNERNGKDRDIYLMDPEDPATMKLPRFQGRSAYFLNEMGIAIIYPNVRGSFGFGRAFEAMDDGVKREDAVKDIGGLLDWIGGQPTLDSTRVMVTGASYGGYMTYATAAAISDFVTYLENTEPGRQEDRRAEYGDERGKDARVPIAQAEAMVAAAKANHVPTWFVVYEDAGHENVPTTAANNDFNFLTWILFVETFLVK